MKLLLKGLLFLVPASLLVLLRIQTKKDKEEMRIMEEQTAEIQRQTDRLIESHKLNRALLDKEIKDNEKLLAELGVTPKKKRHLYLVK